MKFKKLQEKLGKSTWNMFESAKDSINNTIITLVRDKKLDVSDVNLLVSVIATTLQSSYHNAYSVFERTVEEALDDELKYADQQTQQVRPKKS
jgi:hypothetical protein